MNVDFAGDPREDARSKAPGFRAQVLLAEDDGEMRRLLADVLSAEGYAVTIARDGSELVLDLFEAAVRKFPSEPFDLVVTDQLMRGCTGLEAVARLRAIGYLTPVLLVTAFSEPALKEQAERLQAAVLEKPFTFEQLHAAVARCLHDFAQRSDDLALREHAR